MPTRAATRYTATTALTGRLLDVRFERLRACLIRTAIVDCFCHLGERVGLKIAFAGPVMRRPLRSCSICSPMWSPQTANLRHSLQLVPKFSCGTRRLSRRKIDRQRRVATVWKPLPCPGSVSGPEGRDWRLFAGQHDMAGDCGCAAPQRGVPVHGAHEPVANELFREQIDFDAQCVMKAVEPALVPVCRNIVTGPVRGRRSGSSGR
jgi:hypothetical protein